MHEFRNISFENAVPVGLCLFMCAAYMYTVGALNMHCSNSASKLTVQKVNFLILHQLIQNLTQVYSNVASLTLPFHKLSS